MANSSCISVIVTYNAKKIRLDIDKDCDRDQLERAIKGNLPELAVVDLLKITYYDPDIEIELDVTSSTTLYHKAMFTVQKVKKGRPMYAGRYS